MTRIASKLALLAALALTACSRPAPSPIGAEPAPSRPLGAEPAGGNATRRFVPSPLQTNTAYPYFPFTGVVWVEGHALVLLSRRAGDYLAIVEPPP